MESIRSLKYTLETESTEQQYGTVKQQLLMLIYLNYKLLPNSSQYQRLSTILGRYVDTSTILEKIFKSSA